MLKQTFRGHEGRVQFVEFRPQLSQSAGGAALASAATDGAVKLWSLDSDDAIRTLHGHKARLCRVKWHPMGRHVGSTSYDTTWRLWDAETGRELLAMKMPKEIFSLVFTSDGRRVLTSSGDKGGVKIWGTIDWTLTKEEFLEQKRQRYVEWVKANVPKSADKGNKP